MSIDPANAQGSDKRPYATGAPELYRLAYEQGLRSLDEQRDELNGVRNRAGQFIAFVGSATAFLVGTGLKASGSERDASFYFVAVIATLAVVVALVSLWKVFTPRRSMELSMMPGRLVDHWIDRQVPVTPKEADLLKSLAHEFQKMIDANDEPLAHIRWWYIALVISGIGSLMTWGLLAWMQG